MYKIIKIVKHLRIFWTFLICTAAGFILCTGCKLNYKEADITETMAEEIPNSVLDNFSQVVVRDGKISYFFSADHAELFDSTGTTFSSFGTSLAGSPLYSFQAFRTKSKYWA